MKILFKKRSLPLYSPSSVAYVISSPLASIPILSPAAVFCLPSAAQKRDGLTQQHNKAALGKRPAALQATILHPAPGTQRLPLQSAGAAATSPRASSMLGRRAPRFRCWKAFSCLHGEVGSGETNAQDPPRDNTSSLASVLRTMLPRPKEAAAVHTNNIEDARRGTRQH